MPLKSCKSQWTLLFENMSTTNYTNTRKRTKIEVNEANGDTVE